MLANLSEKRCRQKFRWKKRNDANQDVELECFQVSVNILEARNLVLANTQATNFNVVVMLGKTKYTTYIKKKNNELCCKEYLIFEWYTTMKEVQQSLLCLTVMEPRCCSLSRILGQANIDLGVIFEQPNHQIYHKWAQLTLPRDPMAGTVGFLKVDVSITCREDAQILPLTSSDQLEENLLPSPSEQQTANYIISIYNAFGIISTFQKQVARRQEKLPSTYVKVTLCGISARTAVQPQTSDPSYCEQISITEVFPNICPTVRFEVCRTYNGLNSVLACTEIHFDEISYNEDNGFVPTFGPSLLYMYENTKSGSESPDRNGPFYKGALLVALKTVTPYFKQDTKVTNVEPIASLSIDSLWAWEDFCIYCPIFEVSMLEPRLTGKSCGVAITIADICLRNSENEAFLSLNKQIKKGKLHYTGPMDVTIGSTPYGYLNFANAYPVLQQAIRLPAFRFRIYRNNLVQRIAEYLENSLNKVENRLNNNDYVNPSEVLDDLTYAVDVTADLIRKFFEVIQLLEPSARINSNSTHLYTTELDQKQLALQKEKLEKIYHQIKEKINASSTVNLKKLVAKTSKECYSITKKNVKILLIESISFAQKLKTLVFKTAHGWPDIVLWLLNEGSRFAFSKICAPDIIFSEIAELSGKDCGRIQTIYMKPLKCPKHLNIVPDACNCIVGKVELLIWMGLHSEASLFETYLPQELKLKTNECDMCIKAPIMMVKCRVFIYRAMLTIRESSTPPCTFVRVNVLNSVKETQVQKTTSKPIWDQVLTVTCMTRISQDRITACPPEMLVEVYHQDSLGTLEIMGRSKIQPTVGGTLSNDYAPKLKWFNLYNGLQNTGQILISALIKQVPETLVKSTTYNTVVETANTHTQDIVLDVENDVIEEIPRTLKPKYLVYKVDIYWWGLRDVLITRKPCAVLEIDELTMKSEIIAEKKPNCNFSNGRASETFIGNLEKVYSTPLSIKLCDSSTFGRTIFLGIHAVKSPYKYMVNWFPKSEREASLKSMSFTSPSFFKVDKGLFIRKSSSGSKSMTESTKMTISSSMVDDKKLSKWKTLFCRKERDEEEFLLLPMQVKNTSQYQLLTEKSETENRDWWSRFHSSQKVPVDDYAGSNRKIKIYNSELELQPEYGKFKDWCKSLKLYKGKKTGKPEKDDQLRCGILKVGIAIYQWPPSPETVAVNCSGVELERGYFDDFPSNDPSKFLVRVYIVRGQDFNGRGDPYIIVKCGSKQCGDRNQSVRSSINPIFGRTYELQCLLPEDYLLTVSVHNHDTLSNDALIGSTKIDLEDRIYSKHRGRVGLASEYKLTGTAKWRDHEKPSEILAALCKRNHMRPPVFPNGNTVVVNGVEYRDNDRSNKTYISASERKENLCLDLLHKWDTLPICGYHLVPEHVETRTLYNSEKPGVEQGKLLMWLDIFPLKSGVHLPLPVDITPCKVEDYELRVIVWHLQSLRQDSSMEKKFLDLYVKAWIGNPEQAHYTDIHYNSVNGEACFNWRMIFNFQYQHSEKLLFMEKDYYAELEDCSPPILVVQVADSDAESIDDYLAMLTLDLSALPHGSRQFKRSTLNNAENTKKLNLFHSKSVRSWWPLKTIDHKTGTVKFQGMIDLELHLLSKEKAMVMPVGLGRDPPFPLPSPKRLDPKKVESSVWGKIARRGSPEYLIVGIIVALLLVAFFRQLLSSMELPGWSVTVFALFKKLGVTKVRKTSKKI